MATRQWSTSAFFSGWKSVSMKSMTTWRLGEKKEENKNNSPKWYPQHSTRTWNPPFEPQKESANHPSSKSVAFSCWEFAIENDRTSRIPRLRGLGSCLKRTEHQLGAMMRPANMGPTKGPLPHKKACLKQDAFWGVHLSQGFCGARGSSPKREWPELL